MRILLTGSKGQIGQCIKNKIPENWELIAADSKTLNITDANNVFNMVKTFEPDAIINSAAYTNVDKAETEIEKAFAVNATGVLYLAQAARHIGARFIHLSSDYVFNGTQHSPINENHPTAPINVYGQSKASGELLALANHLNTVILRTSWIYSEYGHNFIKTILHKALTQKSIEVVSDQIGCPTYAGDVANIVIRLLEEPHLKNHLYHYSSGIKMSWYDFAKQIISTAAEIDEQYSHIHLIPINTDSASYPAKRPPYTVLDSERVLTDTQSQPPRMALKPIINKLLEGLNEYR